MNGVYVDADGVRDQGVGNHINAIWTAPASITDGYIKSAPKPTQGNSGRAS
jgi:hypothetical protein